MTYNARWLVAEAAQPRFDTDDPVQTELQYDPRNRVVERKLPDGNTETFNYGVIVVSSNLVRTRFFRRPPVSS